MVVAALEIAAVLAIASAIALWETARQIGAPSAASVAVIHAAASAAVHRAWGEERTVAVEVVADTVVAVAAAAVVVVVEAVVAAGASQW